MDGYELFRRDRLGKRGGRVAQYFRECLDCLELSNGNDRTECVWVRISGKANKACVMVGVSSRPPNQAKEADHIFYKQVGESLALVLAGSFNLTNACWKYYKVERKQCRRFLECVEDKFLTQLVREPAGDGIRLGLLLVNREGLVGDVKIGGCLGYRHHELIVVLIIGKVRGGVSRTATLDFLRAAFAFIGNC